MTRLSSLALGLWIAAGSLLAAEPLTVARVEPAAEMNALFTRTNGWIGGDGAYSVTLSPERTVWLFSDTWLGRVEHGRRTNAVLVNNSVGVQTGRGTDARMEFFHGHDNLVEPKIRCIGLPDHFVEHGPQAFWRDRFNLSAEGIVREVEKHFADLFDAAALPAKARRD